MPKCADPFGQAAILAKFEIILFFFFRFLVSNSRHLPPRYSRTTLISWLSLIEPTLATARLVTRALHVPL